MSLFSYRRPCGLIKERIAMKIKSLALVLSAVLMFTAIALGTTAYITDTTGALNRFTVGDVSIHVDETAVDPSGKPIPGAARVEENDYHLVPGRSYVKDPTLTIDAGSESAYIRMLVTLTRARELKAVFGALPVESYVQGWDSDMWRLTSSTEDTAANTLTLEFRFFRPGVADAHQAQIVTPAASGETLPPLFSALTVPGAITGEQLESIAEFDIQVLGQAIQAGVFPSADEAWSAFEDQVNP